MQVEPVPIGPRGRGGRAATFLGLVGLAGALVVAVGLGRVDGTGPDQRLTIASESPASTGPATTEPAASHAASAPPIAVAAQTAVPEAAFGLRVLTLIEASRARLGGELREGLVAVSGFLTGEAGAAGCGGPPGAIGDALCPRVAILRAAAPAIGTPTGPMFIAWIPPGTPLLETLTPPDEAPTAVRGALPVVVIGRFVTHVEPCTEAMFCDNRFVVERVAWAAGEWRERVVVRDPSIAARVAPSADVAHVIASREADRSESVLSQAVVSVEVLRTIDPTAAAEVPAPTTGAVWYVRSVASSGVGDGQRLVSWVVIDDRTGLILASGPDPLG